MPEAIVTRILRLAGYAAYAHELEEATSRLTLWVRPLAAEPYYTCGGCGISIRNVHSWRERRVRDLPWDPWQVWLVIEVHRVRCPRCGVRTERLPFVTGKAPLFKLLLNGTAVGTVNDVVDGARDKERDAVSGMLGMIEIRTMRVVLRSGCLPDRRS